VAEEARDEGSGLFALVAQVDRFHITDRSMRRAQTSMSDALARLETPRPREVRTYLRAVERYFSGFAREARSHLADIDRRLGRVSQLQFNLSAERGVAARRVEATQGVLSRLKELAPP
jgi:hypothetical protein